MEPEDGGMMRRLKRCPAAVAAAIALTVTLLGCDSGPFDTGNNISQDGLDPYFRLDCKSKIEKMTRDMEAFNDNHKPAKKISADTGFVVRVDSNGSNDSSYRAEWIPPYGFPNNVDSGIPTVPSGREVSNFVMLPKNYSVIEMITTTSYIANIRILDYRGAVIRTFRQDFGYHGELQNAARTVPTGLASFLAWNEKNQEGHQVPDGVYLWNITMAMPYGKTLYLQTETGILNEDCSASQ
jgi:hypothetical protein